MLETGDGSWVECDHVLVGVGVEPDTRWLAGTGLDAGGVRVDAQGRTPIPGVYAAGAHATPGSGIPYVGLSAALVAQVVGPA
jgi:pyruvate/2-oxoglutarate dehydrogenase complex dihydrolipoamide dehydrogenase (E3) component